ncbi:MAG: hypothetical protein K8R02_03855 [Anaerohalosphaeraceae bacterium]|nr:hypothetical protein [Anaerohalosphaeraceae bacterium]
MSQPVYGSDFRLWSLEIVAVFKHSLGKRIRSNAERVDIYVKLFDNKGLKKLI